MFANFNIIEVVEFVSADHEVIDRVVLDVNNHIVQIVSYDKSPRVTVAIDKLIKLMHISNINQFIRSNI